MIGEKWVNSKSSPLLMSNNPQPIVFVDISNPSTFGVFLKSTF